MTSDFFIEEADDWRSRAFEMMKIRSDLNFYIVTKRIDRFDKCKPYDWKDGYDNVTICSTHGKGKVSYLDCVAFAFYHIIVCDKNNQPLIDCYIASKS